MKTCLSFECYCISQKWAPPASKDLNRPSLNYLDQRTRSSVTNPSATVLSYTKYRYLDQKYEQDEKKPAQNIKRFIQEQVPHTHLLASLSGYLFYPRVGLFPGL